MQHEQTGRSGLLPFMGKGIRMAKFRIKTAAPKGKHTWEPDMTARVQNSLFQTVAMLAAASEDAEKKLFEAIAMAKCGNPVFPMA